MNSNYEDLIQNKLLNFNQKHDQVKTIVFVEGWSKRMQTAAAKVQQANLLKPLLVFETKTQLEQQQPPADLPYLVIEQEVTLVQSFVEQYVALRKGKEITADVLIKMQQSPLFSAMLILNQKASGAVGGVHYATSAILSNAFRAIGPKKGIKTISSVMMMHRETSVLAFADVSVNPEPKEPQIVDIAINATNFLKLMDIQPQVAFLSFATNGSAQTENTLKTAQATKAFNAGKHTSLPALGEVQFDAAFDVSIRKQKFSAFTGFAGSANTYVFPNLAAANIGYKIAQQMGNWGAVGPIITGLRLPYNDLSRGAKIDDVINTAILTALQTYEETENGA